MGTNFWQGQQVRLRAVEPADAEQFIRWNLDSERARNLDFVWPPQSEAAARAWAEEEARRKLEGDTFRWMIENQDGQTVGSIDTHHCSSHNGTFSYALDIDPGQRGKGYAGEAIRLVLKYYFEELRYQKVSVPVHADNPASIRLHEKLGFQVEGRFRRAFFTGGEYVDVLWFGMTVEEFQQRFS
ncbi:MAG: GNAT family N-acetyltransferase [Anaerolineales bacterium]|nr:GNAT family N-acetyltransferase [Anaerolineales bacterium]